MKITSDPIEVGEYEFKLISIYYRTINPKGWGVKFNVNVKKKIVVLEQIYKNKIQLLLLKIFDCICNKPLGVPTPFNFFTVKKWIKIFRSLEFNFRIFTLKIPLLSILFVIPVGEWNGDNTSRN